MKARIQSVEQLKKVAAQELEEEFKKRYDQAVLDGAIQGMAFVMKVLEVSEGWKRKRQQKLFDAMLDLMNKADEEPEPYSALDIRRYVEEEFQVDFNQLLDRIASKTS